MIAVKRPPAPAALTAEIVLALTTEFHSDPTLSVWDKEFIRSALLAMTFSKCAYCECKLLEQSNYMEVEHFRAKKIWPDKVVEWENLLPSCKHCNVSKGSHDVDRDPIVDPALQDPRSHLYLLNYCFFGKNDIGRTTVEVLDLNDHRNLIPRFQVGTMMHEAIGTLVDLHAKYSLDPVQKNRNKVFRLLRQSLAECGVSALYGSTAATAFLKDPRFPALKGRLQADGLWDAALDSLYLEALSISYN